MPLSLDDDTTAYTELARNWFHHGIYGFLQWRHDPTRRWFGCRAIHFFWVRFFPCSGGGIRTRCCVGAGADRPGGLLAAVGLRADGSFAAGRMGSTAAGGVLSLHRGLCSDGFDGKPVDFLHCTGHLGAGADWCGQCERWKPVLGPLLALAAAMALRNAAAPGWSSAHGGILCGDSLVHAASRRERGALCALRW
jgi:hypothetical protein